MCYFYALVCVGLILAILGSPVVVRAHVSPERRSAWPTITLQSLLDYAVSGAILLLVPLPQSVVGVTAFLVVLSLFLLIDQTKYKYDEAFLELVRGVALAFLLVHLPAKNPLFWLFGALCIFQFLWVIRNYSQVKIWAHVLRDVLFTILLLLLIPTVGLASVVVLLPLFLLSAQRWIIESIRGETYRRATAIVSRF